MLDIVVDARPASIGNGFDVKRILPYRLRQMLGPFIFIDHARGFRRKRDGQLYRPRTLSFYSEFRKETIK